MAEPMAVIDCYFGAQLDLFGSRERTAPDFYRSWARIEGIANILEETMAPYHKWGDACTFTFKVMMQCNAVQYFK